SMRQKELGWHVALYNLKRTIKTSNEKEIQLFLFFKIEMVSFGTTPLFFHNSLLAKITSLSTSSKTSQLL
ncbi:MAG: hypothetical protein KKE05_06870, partial [Nanoarchaeota archaeon]|nr:hypothetical protein [Nanoarchaeota archaeon]